MRKISLHCCWYQILLLDSLRNKYILSIVVAEFHKNEFAVIQFNNRRCNTNGWRKCLCRARHAFMSMPRHRLSMPPMPRHHHHLSPTTTTRTMLLLRPMTRWILVLILIFWFFNFSLSLSLSLDNIVTIANSSTSKSNLPVVVENSADAAGMLIVGVLFF